MKIVVLAGGLSTERDVSFVTGNMVSKALRAKGHQVILLDVFMGYSNKKEDLDGIFDRSEEVSVKVEGIPETAPDIAKVKAMREDKSDAFFGPNVIEMCQMADIVFMALHGENGENGKVQAALDLFGVKYTGTGYFSSAVAMNKSVTKLYFEVNDIPTPHGITLKKADRATAFEKTGLTLPCVVKPCSGGSSIGVSIADTKEAYEKALEEAFRYEEEVVIEDYIKGREFSVGVIDGKALPVIEIAPKQGFYDFVNKYKAGSTIETCPAELSEEVTKKMQYYAERAAEVIGLDTYSRMDFLMDADENLFCLEANTLPGMTPTSLVPQEAAAIGVNFEDLCEQLIRVSMKKYQ